MHLYFPVYHKPQLLSHAYTILHKTLNFLFTSIKNNFYYPSRPFLCIKIFLFSIFWARKKILITSLLTTAKALRTGFQNTLVDVNYCLWIVGLFSFYLLQHIFLYFLYVYHSYLVVSFWMYQFRARHQLVCFRSASSRQIKRH